MKTFLSKYTGKQLKPEEYLGELMLQRVAQKTNESLLNPESPRWRKIFKAEIRFAKQLLKLYSFEAILAALKTPALQKVYTINAQWIDGAIKKEEARLKGLEELKKTSPSIFLPNSNLPDQRPTFIDKKSGLSKLDGL